MTTIDRIVNFVVIANAILNVFAFMNLKPDLSPYLKPLPDSSPTQVQADQP